MRPPAATGNALGLVEHRHHRGRGALNVSLLTGMKSCGPFKASTAAHCAIDDGFDVDCDWIVVIALISSAGPPA